MQMWLSRLMPAKPGQELRVFECPVCERTEYTTPCVGGGKGIIPTYPIVLALLGRRE
jgi:hypothetical protein